MQINRSIFKMYDIRGIIGSDVTSELAWHLGRAFATLLKKENPDRALSVCVGHDMRETSPEFQGEIMRGLLESGVKVFDIGLVSTPALYFAVGHLAVDGGISVTASHNPVEYNGFKFTRSNAQPVAGDTGITAMADLIEKEAYCSLSAGSIEKSEGIIEKHVRGEFAFAGPDSIRPLKIVADTGNGMGATYLDEFFKIIGADVTRLYWELDGSFPNHESNPLKFETLRDLQAKVREVGADIGIATDGDGDRIFYVDNEGEIVEPAIVRGILSQIMLRGNEGATICYDIRPGKITEDMIVESGGVPSLTKVGHSLIKRQMIEENALFGGESSGHFYYRFPTGVHDGPIAATTQILQEMTKQKKPLSEIVKPLQRYYHSGEINFRVESKEMAIEKIKQQFEEGELNELDGITITYPDFWFNVRGSNTESVLRLNLEAVDQATMEAKRDEITNLIKED
jgi:phosphomannomutase